MSQSTKYETFNDYMARYEAVANPLIRAYQHLVQPGMGYAHFTNDYIISLWHAWSLARVEFWRQTGSGILPRPSCPEAPPDDEDHQPCREMWGQMMREIVEQGGANANVESVKATVAKILSSNSCSSHPATCPCKVPNNPWTWKQTVEALEPLGITHHMGCRCNPPLGCKQSPLKNQSSLTGGGAISYKHYVDTCACGTCHKARVLAGTDGAYYMRYKKASEDALLNVSGRSAQSAQSGQSGQSAHNAETCACIKCHHARVASGKQEAYDEWNRKTLQSALENFIAKNTRYSATMRRVYCPSDPAEKEAKLFQEGHSLLKKLSTIIGAEKFQQRLTLIREFVAKLEEFLEPGTGGVLDSTLRKAMECDDNISTREALSASWGQMQSLLTDVFSKPPPEVRPLNSLMNAAEKADEAIRKATTPSGELDALKLFDAMGTPAYSKCPHGLPFYACMPCSH